MVGSTVAERPAAARVGSRLATQVRVLLERWRAVLQSLLPAGARRRRLVRALGAVGLAGAVAWVAWLYRRRARLAAACRGRVEGSGALHAGDGTTRDDAARHEGGEMAATEEGQGEGKAEVELRLRMGGGE